MSYIAKVIRLAALSWMNQSTRQSVSCSSYFLLPNSRQISSTSARHVEIRTWLWRSFRLHDDRVLRQSWSDFSRSTRSASEVPCGPLYSKAASRAPEIASAIMERSRELEAAGYHAQVTPSENSFPLFMHDETGARYALTRSDDGNYTAKNSDQAYSVAELSMRSGTSGEIQS